MARGDFTGGSTVFPYKVGIGPKPGADENYAGAGEINAIRDALEDLRDHSAGWVSVLDKRFAGGAACDGVTDDRAALEALIAAVGSTVTTVNIPRPCLVATPGLVIPDNIRIEFTDGASFVGSAVTFSSYAPRLTDQPSTARHTLEIDHYADAPGQFYAIDVQNHADNGAAPTGGAGAQTAFVVHNYSDRAPAMQLDNTRSRAFILMKNAENATHSAGTKGTGPYLELWGYSTNSPDANLLLARLNHQLVFQAFDDTRPFIFESQTTAPSLRINQANAGDALFIVQTGAGNAIDIGQQGAAHGVQITPSAGADGFYPIIVNGRRNGGKFSISQDGAAYQALLVQKDGTGAGDALLVINKGTGAGVRVQDASGDVARVNADGEVELCGSGKGVLMRSPNGIRYRLTISDAGAVVVAAAP